MCALCLWLKLPSRTSRRIGFQPVRAFVAQATKAVLFRKLLPLSKSLKLNRLTPLIDIYELIACDQHAGVG